MDEDVVEEAGTVPSLPAPAASSSAPAPPAPPAESRRAADAAGEVRTTRVPGGSKGVSLGWAGCAWEDERDSGVAAPC